MLTYEALESRIATWAATQPAVLAVIVVGSRARGEPDHWSDLDLVIFTTNAAHYVNDSAWLSTFAQAWLVYLDLAGGGHPEWYVLYEGGLKLDVLIFGVEDGSLALGALMAMFPYRSVLARGVYILYSRNGSPDEITPIPDDSRPVPTQAEFGQAQSAFLLHAMTTAKFIARSDLYRAHQWLAGKLRELLLTLMEWHAYGRDTWYDGRFLASWADTRVLNALPKTFPHYDQSEMSAALLAMLDLFRWLSHEICERFLLVSSSAFDKIQAQVTAILDGRDPSGD